MEDLDDNFNDLREAVNYGFNFLSQVRATEDTKVGGEFSEDDFGFSSKQKPYFLVYKEDGESNKLVFDSRTI